MAKTTRGLFQQVAARGIIAAIPVAMACAYASGLFVEPPRLAEAKYEMVAEITTTPNTVGLATSPLYGQPKALIEQQLDDLLAIGVTNIRVFVPWGLVEPIGDDLYNWASIDDIMSAAAARNMGVLAQVNATPVWAGANGPGFPLGSGAPNLSLFTDFMSDFANRYKTTVSAYEIWNEPNYFQFFNPINPEAYTEMLKAVYPVLKTIDPTASVVAGAVGATQTFPGVTMSPVDFVQRMLAAGAADFFDALSVHPYGDQIQYSGSCPSCPPNVLTPREQVEAIMGMLTGKKVWITEYGLPTTPGGFTEAQQAAWIKDLLDHWQTYDPDVVGPIFLYTIRDALNPQDPTNLENFYGLWNALGGEKAAVDMLRDWIAAHPVVPGPDPGTDPPPNPIGQIIAAVQQVMQAVIQVAQNAVQSIANFVGAAVEAVVNAISNLVGALLPPAPAATTLVSDIPDPGATMLSASALSEPEVAAAKVAAEGETVAEAEADAAEEVTPAVDSGAETVVEPVVVEPVVEEPVVVEPVVVEPVVEEPEAVTPVETPAESEAAPAESESTPTESDADGSESTNTSGISTSRMKPKSETATPAKTDGTSTDNDKPKADSTTAATSSLSATSSDGSSSDSASSAGSSSDSSSTGSDD